jgi:hypothetical protein
MHAARSAALFADIGLSHHARSPRWAEHTDHELAINQISGSPALVDGARPIFTSFGLRDPGDGRGEPGTECSFDQRRPTPVLGVPLVSVLAIVSAVTGLVSIFGLALFTTARHEHRSVEFPMTSVPPTHVRAFPKDQAKDQEGAIC